MITVYSLAVMPDGPDHVVVQLSRQAKDDAHQSSPEHLFGGGQGLGVRHADKHNLLVRSNSRLPRPLRPSLLRGAGAPGELDGAEGRGPHPP